MGHRPELLAAWEGLKHALGGSSSTLSPELKEQVRRTLALRTGCEFCASLGRPAAQQPDPKSSLAVAFADAVATDHTAISDAQVGLLFEEFTTPQLVELLIWISLSTPARCSAPSSGTSQRRQTNEQPSRPRWQTSLGRERHGALGLAPDRGMPVAACRAKEHSRRCALAAFANSTWLTWMRL
jgi:hypothetical protein